MYILIFFSVLAIIVAIIVLVTKYNNGKDDSKLEERVTEYPKDTSTQIEIKTNLIQTEEIEKFEEEVNKDFLNEIDSGSIEMITDKLHKLSELEKQGLITKEDLQRAKSKLLSKVSEV